MSEEKEAYLWEKSDGDSVRCNLCNFRCLIAAGKTGKCGVRKNIAGVLRSLNYNKLCAAAVDPIEKKPLYHFLPGTKAYSIAAPGCNFKCRFCQNWQISQQPAGSVQCGKISGSQIIQAALESGCKSIAYTYTEPAVFMETAADTAVMAKKAGLKNIFVSNGYMTDEAVDFAKDWLDAINVDLKAFSESFYKDMTGGHLQPVLNTLKRISGSNISLEITTLLIEGCNDAAGELYNLAAFIAGELSPDVAWHVSAFYPAYKMTDKTLTSPQAVEMAVETGINAGLKYVYAGNICAVNNTYCPQCGSLLIERRGWNVKIHCPQSKCRDCGQPLPLVFT